MNASNHPQSKIKAKLQSLISVPTLRRLARSRGFAARAARKIDCLDFVLSFFLCAAARSLSLSNWKTKLCMLNGSVAGKDQPSRQAIWKRLSQKCAAFAEALLAHLLCARIKTAIKDAAIKDAANKDAVSKKGRKGNDLFAPFCSVLIQDSTTIKLADALKQDFKGNISRGLQKAIARIQCILELKTMRYQYFQLGAFCDNDQGAAPLIHQFVQKGTLVLRDLGYFTLSSCQQIINKGGFFVSRFKFGTQLFDARTGRLIKLGALLRKNKSASSVEVLVGKEHKLRLRLILVPLSAKGARERRRRARTDRDRRLNHSKEYMQALGFALLLTNVEDRVWDEEQVLRVYKVRWTIECVFKGFKSAGMQLQGLCARIKNNAAAVRSMLYLWMCFVVVQLRVAYELFLEGILHQGGSRGSGQGQGRLPERPYLSLNRMVAWICENFLFWIGVSPEQQKQYLKTLCCYERRKDRINIAQRICFDYS